MKSEMGLDDVGVTLNDLVDLSRPINQPRVWRESLDSSSHRRPSLPELRKRVPGYETLGETFDISVRQMEFRDGHIVLFGVAKSGLSVCVRIPYSPFVEVRWPEKVIDKIPDSIERQRVFSSMIKKRFGKSVVSIEYDVPKKRRIFGFTTESVEIIKIRVKNESVKRFIYKSISKREIVWEFHNDEPRPSRSEGYQAFSEWRARDVELRDRSELNGKRLRFDVFQHTVPARMQFCCDRDIRVCQWAKVTSVVRWEPLRSSSSISRCQAECVVLQTDIIPQPENVSVPPLIIAVFDIEQIADNGQKPCMTKPFDFCTTISTVFYRFGVETPIQRVVFQLGSVAEMSPCPNTQEGDLATSVFEYDSEWDMINDWSEMVSNRCDVDELCGYNISGYDLPCLYHRVSRSWLTRHLDIKSEFLMNINFQMVVEIFISELFSVTVDVVGEESAVRLKMADLSAMRRDAVTLSLRSLGLEEKTDQVARFGNQQYLTYLSRRKLPSIEYGSNPFVLLSRAGVQFSDLCEFLVAEVRRCEVRHGCFQMPIGSLETIKESLCRYVCDQMDAKIQEIEVNYRRLMTKSEIQSFEEEVRSSFVTRLSRFRNEETTAKMKKTETKQRGESIFLQVQTGRIMSDVYQILKNTEKLSSYTLKDVALAKLPQDESTKMETVEKKEGEFVGDPDSEEEVAKFSLAGANTNIKMDLPYSKLLPYFIRSPLHRRAVAIYCIRDSELVWKICCKMYILVLVQETAALANTKVNDIYYRGQQIKVWNALILYAHKKGFYLNLDEVERFQERHLKTEFTGGSVKDAKTGLHMNPVTVLDFASLYPTIMIAYNICFSSLLVDDRGRREAEAAGLKVESSIADFEFVQEFPALIPEVLKELLAARKVKKRLKARAKSAFEKAVWDGQQLEIKVTCNSVYGFTGATNGGYMPCQPLARSVTGFGRRMLNQISVVMCRDEFKGNIIYGDTDSVMVQFPDAPAEFVQERAGELRRREEEKRVGMSSEITSITSWEDHQRRARLQWHWEIAVRAGEQASSIFPPPIELEPENVYMGDLGSYLLIVKKKYAGVMYEEDHITGKTPLSKAKVKMRGVEAVRRDWCPITRKTQNTLLHSLLKYGDMRAAKSVVIDNAIRLARGTVEIDDLVVTSKVRSHYENPNLAQVWVASQMAKRDPASRPEAGSRIAYVKIKNEHNDKYKQYDEVQHVRRNGIEIDWSDYLKVQFIPPIKRVMDPVLGPEKTNELFSEALVILSQRENGVKPLTAFF